MSLNEKACKNNQYNYIFELNMCIKRQRECALKCYQRLSMLKIRMDLIFLFLLNTIFSMWYFYMIMCIVFSSFLQRFME